MKRFTILFIGLFLFTKAYIVAQQRYLDEVFSNISETKNVRFSTLVPEPKNGGGWYESILLGIPVNAKEHDTRKRNLYMDIFKPYGDQNTKRPVLIVCFGGGFVLGDRTFGDIRALAIQMAKRGYVTAAIDYRLGMNIFDEGAALRAVYRGVQDGRSAVRYFRANAEALGVDPDQIFIAGHSAGGFIALQNAYLDKESERPAATRKTSYRWGAWGGSQIYRLPDQKCLDCVGDNQHVSGKANAVVSLAGAVGFLEHIEGSNDVPNIMFHSKNDIIVSYNAAKPFNNFSILVVGFDLPVAYGSNQVNNRAQALGAPTQLYSYRKRGHDVHVNGLINSVFRRDKLHNDVVPRICQYLYDTRLRPTGRDISGASVVKLTDAHTQTYITDTKEGNSVSWQVKGGKIIKKEGNQVTVRWTTPGEHRLLAIPVGANDAKGDAVSIPVLVIGNQSDLKARLQMYPNPNVQTLKIKLNKAEVKQIEAVVYNDRGQAVYQGKLKKQGTQFSLNVLNLPLGKYYLKIQEGDNITHKTFLKH